MEATCFLQVPREALIPREEALLSGFQLGAEPGSQVLVT